MTIYTDKEKSETVSYDFDISPLNYYDSFADIDVKYDAEDPYVAWLEPDDLNNYQEYMNLRFLSFFLFWNVQKKVYPMDRSNPEDRNMASTGLQKKKRCI